MVQIPLNQILKKKIFFNQNSVRILSPQQPHPPHDTLQTFSILQHPKAREIQKPSTQTFPINQLRAICLKASPYYSSTCLAVARLSWIHHGKAKRESSKKHEKSLWPWRWWQVCVSPFLSVFSFQLSASCDCRFGSSLVPSKTADTREQAFSQSEH